MSYKKNLTTSAINAFETIRLLLLKFDKKETLTLRKLQREIYLQNGGDEQDLIELYRDCDEFKHGN